MSRLGKENEPYFLGYSVTRDRWFLVERVTGNIVWTGRTRTAALTKLDVLTEHWIAARAGTPDA